MLDTIPASTGYAEELRLQALAAREHAIAASSAATNWKAIAALEKVLDQNHRYHAVRADLARRAGDQTAARSAYIRAIALCGNGIERSFLSRQLRTTMTTEGYGFTRGPRRP